MPVGPQRKGWKKGGNVFDPGLGNMTGVYDYNMEGDRGVEAATYKGEGGHSAEVHEHYFESRGPGRRPDLESERYIAGPYKTSFRAQIAAEGLAHRVAGGRADEYRG